MKLVSAKVNGYRRFKEETSMDLYGKLIAVVGANEAGKSSFLSVLQELDTSESFIKTGASQEISRGADLPDNHIVIQATYLLEDSDREQLRSIEDTKRIKWFTYSKAVNGIRYHNLGPEPIRSIKHRKPVVKFLEKALKEVQKYKESLNSENDTEEIQLSKEIEKEIESLADLLESENQRLSGVARFSALAEKMRSSGIAADVIVLQTLATELEKLAAKEETHPKDEALKILKNLRPEFLFFDEENRGLQSEYDVVAIGNNPPKALQNLLTLAKLNLRLLQVAIQTQDRGKIRTLMRDANDTLKNVFKTSWSQSNVHVHLDVDGNLLHVLIEENERDYVKIAERSDGMRQYIALLSFVALNSGEQKPILLIDEAETHLHYDAQADLVQMLTRQTEVDHVIYTTHSIGCLPEDLGVGVRLISTNSPNASVIKNWFWESDKPGFSPLLFGMGASTMAFMPVRYALITEGISDIILLPSLLRESNNTEYLGFQTVSGLSETSKGDFAVLENGAPRTAYLLDADDGGKELEKQLRRAGIDKARIFYLPRKAGQDLVLEDFVKKEVYLKAVNDELDARNDKYTPLALADLPDVKRPDKVKAHCKAQGIKQPSKRAVAYRVLEQKRDGGIVDSNRKKSLQTLFENIKTALGISAI